MDTFTKDHGPFQPEGTFVKTKDGIHIAYGVDGLLSGAELCRLLNQHAEAIELIAELKSKLQEAVRTLQRASTTAQADITRIQSELASAQRSIQRYGLEAKALGHSVENKLSQILHSLSS